MNLKKNSTIGTGSTKARKKNKNQTLSAADICSIIKQCRGSGVSEITFQGLTLKFHSQGNENAVGQSNAKGSEIGTDTELLPPLAQAEQVELMDQEALLEAEQAQLLIDDPVGYERMQIARDIERGRVNQ